jgi:hypothetical protein
MSETEKDQKQFIKTLGPYYALAKGSRLGSNFLKRTFNIWFTRWPLHLRDYEDADFMRHHRESIEKVSLSLNEFTFH